MPGPGRVYGDALARRGARRRGRRGAGRRRGHAPALRVRPPRRARRDAGHAARRRPPRAPRARPACGGRGDGAAAQRGRRAAVRRVGVRTARGDRAQRRARADHGRRVGVAHPAPSDRAARRAARAPRRRRRDRARAGLRHRPHRASGRHADSRSRCSRSRSCDGAPSCTPSRARDGRLLFFGPLPERRRLVPRHRARSRRPQDRPAPAHARADRPRTRACSTAAVLLDGVTDPPPAGPSCSAWAARSCRPPSTSSPARSTRWSSSTVDPPRGVPRRRAGRAARRCRAARPARPRGRRRRARADAVIVVVGTNDDWESEGHDRDVDGPARRPARAHPARGRRQPAHRGGREHRIAGHHRLGGRRARRCSRCGSAARRWHRRWSTCCSAPPIPAGGCPPRSRSASSTTRATATSPARPGRCATARACSWATAGTRRATCAVVPVRPRALVQRRSRSASRACRSSTVTAGDTVVVEVEVTNTGARRGAEVVQCYVAPPRAGGDPAAEGAQGVRQGVARPGRDRRRWPWSWASAPSPTGSPRPISPAGRSRHLGHPHVRGARPRCRPGWRGRPGPVRPAHRPLVRRHRARRGSDDHGVVRARAAFAAVALALVAACSSGSDSTDSGARSTPQRTGVRRRRHIRSI